MKNLNWLSNDVLSILELREDLLFHKLNKDQVKYYIDESRSLGHKLAQDFKNRDIEDVLKKNNVEVIMKESAPGKGLGLRAEIHFDKNTKKITIYKNSMKQIHEVLKKSGINISEKQVFNIHLAHEFYHFLEFRDSKYTNEQLEKVVCFSLGPIKRRSTILRTRELAAHEFCREFLNLKFHPKILDYMFLIDNDSKFEVQLREEVEELKDKYLN